MNEKTVVVIVVVLVALVGIVGLVSENPDVLENSGAVGFQGSPEPDQYGNWQDWEEDQYQDHLDAVYD
ncbi:hypothetical protein CMO91_06020 [Candidatus Woesearchaeota archaeon]|nr:hypothetical protein [Candidatus Woesearchaeota archaeon]|tara:strand:+ start:92 stop:295 length:204 start_codon:yes stop_codon:yes gene_type:complete